MCLSSSYWLVVSRCISLCFSRLRLLARGAKPFLVLQHTLFHFFESLLLDLVLLVLQLGTRWNFLFAIWPVQDTLCEMAGFGTFLIGIPYERLEAYLVGVKLQRPVDPFVSPTSAPPSRCHRARPRPCQCPSLCPSLSLSTTRVHKRGTRFASGRSCRRT